jgi:uncharacterized protein YigE (DUF2233 family)
MKIPHITHVLLAACLFFPAASWPAQEAPPGLRHERVEHRGVLYDVVWVDLEQREISLHWKRPDGKPHENIARLRRWLDSEGQHLLFATNAGIYARDNTPLGLHVEQGEELRPLNPGRGGGNFFLKPNGVFYIDEAGAHVVTTEAYEEQRPTPEMATQSGPMLVIDGELHPRFLVDATSKYIRNGVGVRNSHEVAFVISRQPVIFRDFGLLFQEVLQCPDALYLDGSISALYAPFAGRRDAGVKFTGMLAVTAPKE